MLPILGILSRRNMWLLNNKNPDFAIWLVPWFIPVNQDPINMSWKLRQRLKETPDDTLCLVAIEKNIIQAVLIAYTRKRDVWLWQAHGRKGFRFSKLMFNGLIHWTRGKSKKRIRCKVTNERNRKLYELKYGFKSKRNKEMYLNVA